MAQSWVCPAGHRGSERLPLPTCPVCGLPVDYAKDKVLDETLAGSPSRPVQDLVFLDEGSPSRRHDTQLDQTLAPPSRPALPPLAPQDRPTLPTGSHSERPSALSWIPLSGPLSEANQDGTRH